MAFLWDVFLALLFCHIDSECRLFPASRKKKIDYFLACVFVPFSFQSNEHHSLLLVRKTTDPSALFPIATKPKTSFLYS